jgi:hypothetical protein
VSVALFVAVSGWLWRSDLCLCLSPLSFSVCGCERYPYVALRPLNFYDMFLAVQSFGGYFAITAANNRCPLGTFVASLPTRIPLDICDLQTKHSVVSDETGSMSEFSRVYRGPEPRCFTML